MNDFTQHRAALAHVWADTNPDSFEDTQPMDFSDPIDPGYMEDAYSNVVWLVTFVLLFCIAAAVFS